MRKAICLFLFVLLCLGAPAQIPSPRGFGLQAHRGLCKRYPENSLLSFREAGKVGVYYGMETDIQLTSDGHLVCMHDDSLMRTVGVKGRVADYTLRELRRMRLSGGRGWDNRYAGKLKIPTFREYLRICRRYGLVPYVEMKNLPDEGVQKAIDLLSHMGFDGKYVLTSFYFKNLAEAAKYTTAPLEYMRPDFGSDDVERCEGAGNFVLRPDARKITPAFMEYARSKGFLVECYGIPPGDAGLVARLIALGVIGGTCDDYEGLNL